MTTAYSTKPGKPRSSPLKNGLRTTQAQDVGAARENRMSMDQEGEEMGTRHGLTGIIDALASSPITSRLVAYPLCLLFAWLMLAVAYYEPLKTAAEYALGLLLCLLLLLAGLGAVVGCLGFISRLLSRL